NACRTGRVPGPKGAMSRARQVGNDLRSCTMNEVHPASAGDTYNSRRRPQLLGGDNGNTILGGATEIIQGWGYDTTVASGGVEVVACGGLASGPLLTNGATLVVSSGGLAFSTGIGSIGYASAGEIIVSNGGTESAGYVIGNAVELVASGGTAIGEDVLA